MNEIIQSIFNYALTTDYAGYAATASMICYTIVHIVAVLPERFTQRIPNPIMRVISVIAGNYNKAQNLKTDTNGNKR